VLKDLRSPVVANRSVLPQRGDTVGGKYRIERELGTGGMGAVFEATHRVTHKRFAIKWLLPDLSGHEDVVKRFIREAQVAGRFEHPNVVEVYDIGQEGDSFYMVMELLEGESLAARLERDGKMTPEAACRMLLPCMRGVARAHAAGIIHRDLKPANIFVCRATPETPETPKVLDFGISKMSGLGEFEASTTKTGVVMGTPHYMSPEQVRGRSVDHRADVYAFGLILYQLVSGKLPFDAMTFSELVLQIATETPKPLADLVPGMPNGLARVISRAMAREAGERFQTLEELALAVEPYAAGMRFESDAARGARDRAPGSTVPLDTPLATESQSSLPAVKRSQRALVIGVLAALALVVALGGVILSLLTGEPETAEPAPAGGAPRSAASAGQPPAVPEPATTPSAATADPALDSEPRPHTIRLEPEAQEPARVWQPPADEQPAPAPRELPNVVSVPAQPETPIARPGRRAAPDSRRKPSEASSTQRTPQASEGGGARKPAGRLGVSMDEGEF
jgi:eukaryotic-like serine/threonine-protein kinase